VLLY
jgi:hypothetical protein